MARYAAEAGCPQIGAISTALGLKLYEGQVSANFSSILAIFRPHLFVMSTPMWEPGKEETFQAL